jgi:hypothetical protein
VLELLVLLCRAIAGACRGHQDVVLENLALRHQLRKLPRTVKRPHLRTGERLFWVLLATVWQQWQLAILMRHQRLRWPLSGRVGSTIPIARRDHRLG